MLSTRPSNSAPLRVTLACLTILTLGACARSGNLALSDKVVDLPPKPAYAQPAEVKDPARGEDPLKVAARERAGRVENANRLNAFGQWYDSLREKEASPK